MPVTYGNDYDHIDLGGNRHMLKDSAARIDIADLKSAIDLIAAPYVLSQDMFTQGAINTTTGEGSTTAENRIKTGYLSVKTLAAMPANGYKIGIAVYDPANNNEYKGFLMPDGTIKKNQGSSAWHTEKASLMNVQGHILRFVIGTDDDSNVTPSDDYAGLLLETVTDKTLSGDNKAADAKAVGDSVAALGSSLNSLSGYTLGAGYAPLEYLEAHGNGYVSMGTKLKGTSRVLCEYAATDAALNGTGGDYIFGVRKNTSAKVFGAGIYGSPGRYYIPGYGSTTLSPSNIFCSDKNRHILDMNQNNVYLDGELAKTFTAETFETDTNAVMFAMYGSSNSTYYYGNFRIYRCTVYDDGTLIRDFLPARRLSDDALGMYDAENNVFYAATGTFTTGATISLKTVSDAVSGISGRIAGISSNLNTLEDEIDDINDAISGKAYIVQEADRVAANVRNVQTGKTLTFVACSDLHYAVAVGSGDGVTVADSQAALADMRDGIKKIAEQLHIDFYACFGDVIYQWTSHGANYDNGVAEMVSVTKLLNEAFGIAPQIRLIGNHDPNCENATKEFDANLLYSFSGIYSEMLEKDEEHPFGAYGLRDFDRQKIRLIALNTSYYAPGVDIDNSGTRYYFSKAQADWLVGALDLSAKEDAAQWQIVVFSHVPLDDADHNKLYPYTDILAKYEAGGSGSVTVNGTTTTYNFSGKNAAKLAVYINGHEHKYGVKNVEKIVSAAVDSVLSMANIYVPNALPGRNFASVDGVTYAKTANSATSTAFQIITIDPDSKTLYAHHYGAGIDFILHYAPQAVTGSVALSTNLTSPAWTSNDTGVATVSGGTITPVVDGNTMIWAKSTDDNCIEAWNIAVDV